MKKNFPLAVSSFFVVAGIAQSSGPSFTATTKLKAEITKTDNRFQLLRGGPPYFVSFICNGSTAQKRKLIGSMFPEKLTFDGFQYRTTRVNEAISLINLINDKLESKKNGTSCEISNLSQEVNPLVQNSNHFLADLKLLGDLLAA